MAINPKEKAALAAAWKKSKPAVQGRLSTCEWADGEYQFEVTTWEADAAKARIKAGYTIVGGNEAYMGQEHLQYENLTGSENSMDYFKARLVAFGLTEDDIDALDPEEVLGDTLKGLVIGKKFVGQAKNKNDYLNVYANRPIEGDGDEATAESEEAKEPTEASDEVQVGDQVSFTSKIDGDLVGEVVDVEGEMAQVKAGKKTYKLGVSRLTKVAADEEAAEETVEEEAVEETEETEEAEAKNGNGNGKHKSRLPQPKAIQSMKAPELRELFKGLGIKFEAVKQPRELAIGIAGFVHDKKYMPSISLLPALVAGLGVKVAKGAKPAVVVSQLREKAVARFS